MTFEHPLWLWLIVPALALALVDARRRWPATTGRRIAAVGVRAVVLCALATAAAEPHWVGTREDTTVVFLIDRSASISDAALADAWAQAGSLRKQLGPDARVAVVELDATAHVAIAPGDPWLVPAQLRGAPQDRDATDLGGAIRLALGLVPPGGGGRLVLLGDGRANAGDLAAATTAATARGVPVDVVPTAPVADDPAIAAVALDADRVRAGATVTGHVDVDAGGATGTAKVAVRVDGKVVSETEVQLTAGHQEVPFTYPLPPTAKPGVSSIEATLEVPQGATNRDADNDRGAARLSVERPPHVVILDGDDGGGTALASALRADQIDVTVQPAAVDGPPPDLASTDLVILANAPVRAGIATGVLDDQLGERLVKWVNDGGGLLVLGGPSALDGNYAANRLADALPIQIEPMSPELDSSATVIVILDMSGSMGERVGPTTKLGLAAEGASAVIRLLRSFDRIGVMAVEDRVHWTVPLRMVGEDKAMLEAKARAVNVGGDGIFVYTSLVAAQKALADVKSPLRHVILFSDTFDAAEQVQGIDYGTFSGWPSRRNNSFQVAKEMRDQGITLSVIGVGNGNDAPFDYASYTDNDDDSSFLKELANVGGGRYYRTTDGNQLRGLFVQDARRLLDNRERDEDIRLKALVKLPALDGVDLAHAPPLHGFQEVKPRPAAQVAVTDAAGNPILTRWPYGLGEVAVWSSDAGPRWAKDWLKWPGYARFWTQLVRASLRRHEGDASAIEADVQGDRATVRVVRRVERAGAPVPKARVVQDGQARELPLHTVAPGVYEAPLTIAAAHEPTVELVDDRGQVSAHRTLVRPASAELRQRGPDADALGKIAKATGGTVSPSSIAAAGRDIPASTPLAAWLLLLAILALPLDATLRRPMRYP